MCPYFFATSDADWMATKAWDQNESNGSFIFWEKNEKTSIFFFFLFPLSNLHQASTKQQQNPKF
jgi:hypothetical protein